MARSAFLNTRIEPTLKQRAEKIFAAIGVSASDAITMFYQQVIYRRGLPFDVCIPNEETLAAISEVEAGGGEIVRSSTDEAFDSILGGGTIRGNEAPPNHRPVQKRPKKDFKARISARKAKAHSR